MKLRIFHISISAFFLVLIPSLGYDLYSHILTYNPDILPALDSQNTIKIYDALFPRYVLFSYLQVAAALGGLLPAISIFFIVNVLVLEASILRDADRPFKPVFFRVLLAIFVCIQTSPSLYSLYFVFILFTSRRWLSSSRLKLYLLLSASLSIIGSLTSLIFALTSLSTRRNLHYIFVSLIPPLLAYSLLSLSPQLPLTQRDYTQYLEAFKQFHSFSNLLDLPRTKELLVLLLVIPFLLFFKYSSSILPRQLNITSLKMCLMSLFTLFFYSALPLVRSNKLSSPILHYPFSQCLTKSERLSCHIVERALLPSLVTPPYSGSPDIFDRRIRLLDKSL